MAEVVLWQYRWLNPSNEPHQPPSMLEWKNVEHPHWQPLESKLQELRDYRYDGKPCYEVRGLGVIVPGGVSPTPAPEPVYWQWRRVDEDWTLKMTFNSEPVVTAPGTEMRPLYAGPVIAYGVNPSRGGER